ncbi:hypothetical protein CW304_03785 [Bacillus sp. UFRGS-B20]|nr:hypothetical protein CW304_03785 [Bacillus sp. UFRGS-B20]
MGLIEWMNSYLFALFKTEISGPVKNNWGESRRRQDHLLAYGGRVNSIGIAGNIGCVLLPFVMAFI